MSQLRLYTFINFYLSSIQQGIQSAHVLGDMFVKYRQSTRKCGDVYNWAENHKTMIVLNGGANQDIKAINAAFAELENSSKMTFPFSPFHEDDMSLNTTMTGVGIILPEEIFDAVSFRKAKTLVVEESLGDGCGMTNQFNRFCEYESGSGDFIGYLEEDFFFVKDGKIVKRYEEGTPEWKIISIVSSCPLAR